MSFVSRVARAVLFLPPPPQSAKPAQFDPNLSREVDITTNELRARRGLVHSTMKSVRDSAESLRKTNDELLDRNRWS